MMLYQLSRMAYRFVILWFENRKLMEKSNSTLSLRDHTILLVRIEEPGSGNLVSRMYFVDLAGSGKYYINL